MSIVGSNEYGWVYGRIVMYEQGYGGQPSCAHSTHCGEMTEGGEFYSYFEEYNFDEQPYSSPEACCKAIYESDAINHEHRENLRTAMMAIPEPSCDQYWQEQLSISGFITPAASLSSFACMQFFEDPPVDACVPCAYSLDE